MKLEFKPHQWSCLATSFAMALGITTRDFEVLAWHDGGAIVFPGLPEPLCRRGFHVSEAVRVAMSRGYSATPLELFPQIAPSLGTAAPAVVHYDGHSADWNWLLFARLIETSQGVIECKTRSGNYHAVGYSHGRIYDPDGREFDYSRENCEGRGLFTLRLWRVEKVKE